MASALDEDKAFDMIKRMSLLIRKYLIPILGPKALRSSSDSAPNAGNGN